MKSIRYFYSFVLVTFICFSCKKETETVSKTQDTAPKEIIMPRVQAIPTQTNIQQPVTQAVTTGQNQNTVQNAQTITQTPVVTKAGMNPPHGQPGHKCEIAVGAPLNSAISKPKPGATITQQPTFTTTTTNSPSSTVASTPALLNPNSGEITPTAAGMNPPHGQAGHDCAVAVGAPLSKK